MNLTKQVIEILVRSSPRFRLFLDHHFEIRKNLSLVPQIRRGKASFPVKYSLIPKDKTLEEKLRYYQEDIELWRKEVQYPKKIIITYQTEES